MTDAKTDISAEAVEQLADELPETNWQAPRLYRAADTLRALRQALTDAEAKIASMTPAPDAELDALVAKASFDLITLETVWQDQMGHAPDNPAFRIRMIITALRAQIAALTAERDAAVDALSDIANPKRLASNGDPTVLRDYARAALAAHAARKGGE